MTILITGSSGLIGTALRRCFEKESLQYVGLDLRALQEDSQGDILDRKSLSDKIKGCTGVVHLAAVSRVVLAQNFPSLCWSTNVLGTRNILLEALNSPKKPWVIYASSREVYGQQAIFPVKESAGLSPLNTYGLSKVCCEMEVLHARSLGLRTSILRFSNVYGGENDHKDRVIPAFVAGALSHTPLRLEGPNNIFDFTHVEDVARGIVRLIHFINLEKSPPLAPMHFVSGRGTTLEALANLVRHCCNSFSQTQVSPSRTFDVNGFVGNPDYVRQTLGWSAEISLEEGLSRMARINQKAA